MTPDDGDVQIVTGLRDILLRQFGGTWRSVGVNGRNDVVAGSKTDVVASRAGGRADVVRGTTLRS